MKRLWLLAIITISVGCAPISSPPSTSVISTRHYSIHQQLSLVNEGDSKPTKQNLWVALIRDFPPYQEVVSRTIAPNNYTLVTDEYENQYAEFDLSEHPAGTTITIEIEYQISINELTYDLSLCKGSLPDEFINSELHIESNNPQIISLANELAKRKSSICDQVRAFYDYAGDELIYSYNRNPWGAQATFGLMGADCTEYASLVIALSRAEEIPARYYEGLLFLDEKAKDTNLAQVEHAWLDVYLPGTGWVAMDPTLGRSQIYRDIYFAHYTPDHIIVTTGRNPSTLRGASYWSHLYWPGNITKISIQNAEWTISPIDPQ